jgi:hypothetical protein
MEPERILADIDNHVPRDEVTVFRYQKGRALIILLLSGSFAVGLLAVAIAMAPTVNPDASPALKYGLAAFVGLLVLLGAWAAWSAAADLRYANSNLILVCPEGVIRRLRGRVRSWPFAQYPDVAYGISHMRSTQSTEYYPTKWERISLDSQQAGERPQQEVEDLTGGHPYRDYYRFSSSKIAGVSLNEKGASFADELVSDSTFGPMADILDAIVSRGRRG